MVTTTRNLIATLRDGNGVQMRTQEIGSLHKNQNRQASEGEIVVSSQTTYSSSKRVGEKGGRETRTGESLPATQHWQIRSPHAGQREPLMAEPAVSERNSAGVDARVSALRVDAVTHRLALRFVPASYLRHETRSKSRVIDQK